MSVRRVNEVAIGLLVIGGLAGLVYQAELGKSFTYWRGALFTLLPLYLGLWVLALAWAVLRQGPITSRLHRTRGRQTLQ